MFTVMIDDHEYRCPVTNGIPCSTLEEALEIYNKVNELGRFYPSIREDDKDLDLDNDERIRKCDRCGDYFCQGYFANYEYYCESCRPQVYPEPVWAKLCEESDDYYWTDWND